jgi:hypothetical protein
MPIDCVYFNDNIRCYRNGVVERYWYWLKKPAWRVVPNTANKDGVYNRVDVDGKSIKRHRIIAFCFIGDFDINNPKEEVDHIDGDGLNNAVDNLRTCSGAGNHQNRTTAKGYYKTASGKYVAHIRINGRQIYGKSRLTIDEACQDRADLKAKYHTYFQDKEKELIS